MEGRIPTMPAVYHRNFKILYTTGTPQATTSRVEYITTRPITCPQCRSRTLKLYDHYSRKAAFINHEGVQKNIAHQSKTLQMSALLPPLPGTHGRPPP